MGQDAVVQQLCSSASMPQYDVSVQVSMVSQDAALNFPQALLGESQWTAKAFGQNQAAFCK
jgi:hypothetical protein